jgi:hypothetical protein
VEGSGGDTSPHNSTHREFRGGPAKPTRCGLMMMRLRL